MTNPDRCREDFEKWAIAHKIGITTDPINPNEYWNPYVQTAWEAWQAATQATARRCVELCEQEVVSGRGDEVDGALACCAAIATEFGLQGK